MNALQELRQEHKAVKLTLRVLDRICRKIELEKIGAGKHEEFHKMIDHLEKAYLT